ncbi:hypothetical protein [Glycomyces sp. NPDC021274]|uniref:hypothetical protein n=1 Tax=Glycomyces sp. NPDC021274 TaxID=3155120 RepID=UPI003410AB1F
MSTERFEYVRDELAKAKAYIDETKALIDKYSAPASGMPHTPAQGETEYRCPNCDRWAPWTDGVIDGDDEDVAEFWCQTCGCQTAVEDMESRPAPSMPVPAAQPGAGDAETSGTGSGRGTGVPEAQNSRQAIEGLNSRHWLKWNTITRTITGCQCGFGANEDSDCGFGDSVVAHLLKVAAEAAEDSWFSDVAEAVRPVHCREAAASLQVIADAAVADGLHHEFVEGLRFSARLMDSTARDLDEEAGR